MPWATGARASEGALAPAVHAPAATAARVVVLTLALAAAGCGPGHEFRGTPVVPPRPAPEIHGIDQGGHAFRLSSLRGKVVVLFFGYTSCPDVCPMTLAKLRGLRAQLGPHADEVAVALVSVDPDRDTRERLARYVAGFDAGFHGLRLPDPALAEVARAYGVRYERQRPSEPGGYYAVDHTATLFVVDPEGQLRLTYTGDASVDEMLPDLQYLLSGSTAQG